MAVAIAESGNKKSQKSLDAKDCGHSRANCRPSAQRRRCLDHLDVERLLGWYERNKRDFPWRRDPDPYKVWVCEVMSQQTTLAVVLPYFERFVQMLPDCASLAASSEDTLRSLWQGLGYYSRARNLKRGAQYILAVHGGCFPNSYSSWLCVPGCGPYTAAVVSSICFHECIPCVDGNVIRVYSRLTSTGEGVWQAAFRVGVVEDLMPFVPKQRPGDFNQAMMELGATICKPRQPDCLRCPIQSSCSSFAEATVSFYPPPKPRRQKKDVKLWAAVLFNEASDSIAVVKRRNGFLAQTIGFPLFICDQLPAVVAAHTASDPRLTIHPRAIKHVITHHRLEVHPVTFCGSVAEAARLFGIWDSAASNESVVWVPRLRVLESLASSLDRKVWSVVR